MRIKKYNIKILFDPTCSTLSNYLMHVVVASHKNQRFI